MSEGSRKKIRRKIARAIHPDMTVWKREGDITTQAREVESSIRVAEEANEPTTDDIRRIARDWDRLKQRLAVWPDE